MNIVHSQTKDTYGNKLVLSILILFMLMIAIMYKIHNSTPSTQNNGFIAPAPSVRTIYILSSKPSALLYAKNGTSPEVFISKLKKFSSFLESIGYKTKITPASEIDSLPKKSVLFVIDSPALKDTTKTQLKTYIQNGGSLFFNFTAGFSDESGNYLGDRFVHEITGLALSKRFGFASFKSDDGSNSLFMTPKMLSPFASYLHNGPSLYVVLYDKLPIYVTPENMKADMLATSFSQATPPVSNNWKESMTVEEAGLGWHGYMGKGKWIYTSLPSYSFYDITEEKEKYKKLLSGMVDFLSKDIISQTYPFVDQKNAIFISEDTEYKFTNFQRFADLAKEYRFPVTAFIVANLAQKPEHQQMMREIAKNPYVEFASHSTTHQKIVGESEAFIINETSGSKKILGTYAKNPIQGFRPPREELNDLMKKHLSSSGFTYILGATEEHLYPEFDQKEPNLLIIPRHGTDDYSYLVNLDWNQHDIVDQMIREAHFVTDLNGIYTLSVHTHLFTYSTNINILRKFFRYLKEHPEFKTLSGKDIYKKVSLAQHIRHSMQTTGNQLVMTVQNDNLQPVKNLHIQLFKSPANKIIKGGVSDKGVTVQLDPRKDVIIIDQLPPQQSIKIFLTLEQKG